MKYFTPPHALAHIPPCGGVLLALSGGADSRALLHLLAADAQKQGYPLHLAHVHHGIRDAEADRDEQFCRDLAHIYHCPIHVLHADIPSIVRQTGESAEMAGRRVRYAYFARLMREHDLTLLTTAHHADDHTETVLMRLLNGSSTAGLGGISPVQPFEEGYLVRPLLTATREDILALCKQQSLAYVTDSTNADTAYLRNRIRAELMPVIARIAPHPQQQVLRTSQMLREDDDYLNTCAAQAYEQARTPGGALPLDALRATPPPLRRRMLLRLIRDTQEDVRVDACHLQALCERINAGHGMVDLPGSLRAIANGHTLALQRKLPQDESDTDLCLPLTEGTHDLPQLGMMLIVEQLKADIPPDPDPPESDFFKNPQNLYTPFIHATRTLDILCNGAHFRLRKEGDTLLLHGMHKKIRKLQNEAGIPPALRQQLPLLCDAQGVLWVPFIGVRDQDPTTTARLTRFRIRLQLSASDASQLSKISKNNEV